MIYLNQVVESSLIDGWASKWEEDPSENDIEDKQASEELEENQEIQDNECSDEGNYDFVTNNSGVTSLPESHGMSVKPRSGSKVCFLQVKRFFQILEWIKKNTFKLTVAKL